MDQSNRLADLKLVNKYYPVAGVANYSYPSPKMDSPAQCDFPAGRSSVGSQASVPDMVDDQESDMSVDGDDRSAYHISGAELWETYWKDPFWDTNAEEASREADCTSQRTISSNANYPALIPSPDETLDRQGQYFGQRGTDEPVIGHESTWTSTWTSTWPLATSQLPAVPRPATPKATYSLFPRPTPTPTANRSPRKSNLAPRSTSLWQTPKHTKSSVSLSSLGRSSRANRAHLSDVVVSYGRSSWTQSAPATPVLIDRSASAIDLSARRDSGQSLAQRQRFPIKVPVTSSDTVVSRASVMSTGCSASLASSQHNVPVPPERPSRLPERSQARYSQPEAPRIPPPLELHRCMTETNLPSYQQAQPHTPTRLYYETSPSSPAVPPAPEPMPVSVFELDSDEEEETRSFARRIARSFAPQKRTRSASATTRSRRGQEVAKEQLRRAGAGAGAGTAAWPPVEKAEVCGVRKDEGERGPEMPVLRRQKSEVFGKMFWGRR